jgi:putative phosphoesterase
MLIAFVSDIHGNLPALEAACADAKRRGAGRIICCGDMTGYGPFPNDVCHFLHARGIPAIIGNYDQKVIEAAHERAKFVKNMKAKKLRILWWTVDHCDRASRRYLAGLPHRLDLQIPSGGRQFLIAHGGPLSANDAVYPSITRQGMEKKLGDARPDVLVCGHTHIPFVRHIGGVLVVNCGSAGHPVDGDRRPSYALVHAERRTAPRGHIVRFDYEWERTVAALKKTSLPKGLREDFSEGNKRRFSE